MSDTDEPDPRHLPRGLDEERLRDLGRRLYAEVRETSEREESELASWRVERKKTSVEGAYSADMFDLLWRNGEGDSADRDSGGD